MGGDAFIVVVVVGVVVVVVVVVVGGGGDGGDGRFARVWAPAYEYAATEPPTTAERANRPIATQRRTVPISQPLEFSKLISHVGEPWQPILSSIRPALVSE